MNDPKIETNDFDDDNDDTEVCQLNWPGAFLGIVVVFGIVAIVFIICGGLEVLK